MCTESRRPRRKCSRVTGESDTRSVLARLGMRFSSRRCTLLYAAGTLLVAAAVVGVSVAVASERDEEGGRQRNPFDDGGDDDYDAAREAAGGSQIQEHIPGAEINTG